MQDLEGGFQNGFVADRIISDNCWIAHEMMNTIRKKKGEKMVAVFKMDLNKAYDRVSWDFIERVLRAMKF